MWRSSSLLLLTFLLAPASAFLLPYPPRVSSSSSSSFSSSSPLWAAAATGLEIGEVLSERDPTLKVTRVSVEEGEDAADKPICAYLVEAEVYGPDVKKTYNQALKAGTLNANFPGFRKGVMPPHALVGVKLSAVTASIMDVCRTAMELHGLENFPVNERKLRMKKPKTMEELATKYEVGKDLAFSCEIDAIGVPGEPLPPKEPMGGGGAGAAGAAGAKA